MTPLHFLIQDEHRPGIQSYQIISGDYTVARNVNPSFVQMFIQMADTLNGIQAKDGQCIYGTADYHDAPPEVKEAFRHGSALAFTRMAEMARSVSTVPPFAEREVEISLTVSQ